MTPISSVMTWKVFPWVFVSPHYFFSLHFQIGFWWRIDSAAYAYRPNDTYFIQQCMGYYIALNQSLTPIAPQYPFLEIHRLHLFNKWHLITINISLKAEYLHGYRYSRKRVLYVECGGGLLGIFKWQGEKSMASSKQQVLLFLIKYTMHHCK